MHVHGGGRTLAADGMAIWYTKQRMEPGPVFGSRDNFHGLALFLDTYKNGPQAVSIHEALYNVILCTAGVHSKVYLLNYTQ